MAASFDLYQQENITYSVCSQTEFFNTEGLKTLYYAMIQPHIQYGILAWGNARSSALQTTVSLQKRAKRTINIAHYNSHTEPLFSILKVTDMYEYQVVLFMHDYKTHKLPIHCMSPFAEKLPRFNFPHIIWNRWLFQIANIPSRNQLKK